MSTSRLGALAAQAVDGARAGTAAAVAHPRTLGVLAVVVGLLAGAWLPLPVAGLVAVAAGGLVAAATVAPARAGWAAVAVLLVATGVGVAVARTQVREATALAPRFGHVVSGSATLGEAPRARPDGSWWASAQLLGEPVLLRVGRWAADDAPAGRADPGTVLEVTGALEAPDAFARSRGAHAALRVSRARAGGRRRGGALGVVDGIRRRAEIALGRRLPAAQGGLLQGMALGQDARLPDAVRDDFRAAGLSHLVAASGTNVALLAALVLGAGTLAGLGRRTRLGLTLAAIGLYVPLAGAGPPIVRAGVMGVAVVAAALAGRPAHRWHAFALAALVTLLHDPRAAASVGWELSFAAVAAIALLAPRWQERLRRRGLPPVLAEAVAMTLAATLATAPLAAAWFGTVSLAALPANVLAAPVVAPIMWLGYVAALFGQLSPDLGGLVAWPAGVLCGYLTWLAHAMAALPGGVVAVGALPALVACVALVALDRSTPLRRAAPGIALAGVLAALALWPARATPAAPPTGLRLSVLDIGQGNALLLQDGARSALFDTGPPDGPVLRRLREAGVARLDLLVITHGSSDHEGMGAAILDALPVGRLVDGRRTSGAEPDEDPATGEVGPADAIRAAAAAHGVPVSEPAAGQQLALGASRLDVLWPPPIPSGAVPPPVEDHNERAMVTLVSSRGRRLLIPADAESPVLGRLDLPPLDVLQISHHGSEDPGLPEELRRTHPAVAVIPVGRHNSFGHPRPGTLGALAAAGVPVLRTDRDGTIRLDLTAGGWLVRTTGPRP